MTTPANPHRPKHIADALAANAPTAPADGQDDPFLVTLARPIVREGSTLATFRLREPDAGEMRGLTMQDLLTCDVASVITLIPRIAAPQVTKAEAEKLKPVDLAQCAGIIRSFFLTEAERQAVMAG